MKTKLYHFFLPTILILNLFCLMLYWFPSTLSFQFYLLTFFIPIFCILNIFPLIYFLVKKRYIIAGISLILILANLQFVSLFIALKTNNEEPPQNKDTLKILSFNASFFKIPKLFSKAYYSSENNQSGELMRSFLLNSDADVICLQEFLNDDNFKRNNMIERLQNVGYEHYYFLNNPQHDNGIKRGVATFSKFPICSKKDIFLSDNNFNGAISTDLKINNDTVRIINVHLESNEFAPRQTGIMNKAKDVLRTYFRNYKTRANQLEYVNREILNSNHPTIVAGDFNSLRNNPDLRHIIRENHLRDAFSFHGSGFGSTLQTSYNLPMRIDYFLVSNELLMQGYGEIRDMNQSDHYPIQLYFSLLDKQ